MMSFADVGKMWSISKFRLLHNQKVKVKAEAALLSLYNELEYERKKFLVGTLKLLSITF